MRMPCCSCHLDLTLVGMAAAESNMEEQIEQELTCSICLELFTRPKMLPCQHTFCQDCLQDIARKTRPFQCPNCRQKIVLPEKGAAGFPNNNLVGNLCDTLRKRMKEKDKGRQQNHPKVKCSSHSSKDIDLYCNRCKVPVCFECLREDHKLHPMTDLETALQEKKASRDKLLTEANNISKTYSNFLEDLRKYEIALDEQKEKRDDKIDQALDKAIQHFTEAKDSLKLKNEQEHAKNIDALETKKEEVIKAIGELSPVYFFTKIEVEGIMETGGVELLFTEATWLQEMVTKYRGKSLPTPMSVQTVEFQPTDPETLTLGQLSSNKKPSWLWRIIRILLQVLILVIWLLGFLVTGFMYIISIMTVKNQNYHQPVIHFLILVFTVTVIVLSLLSGLYCLMQEGRLRSILLLLFAIYHVLWLGTMLGHRLDKYGEDDVGFKTVMIVTMVSSFFIMEIVTKNNNRQVNN
ncbi:E3 ubiquitin-protein ligase TRIM63-like [Branchiostoma floridae x Branchiostoma japonicum]